jgi:hypothetical protein
MVKILVEATVHNKAGLCDNNVPLCNIKPLFHTTVTWICLCSALAYFTVLPVCSVVSSLLTVVVDHVDTSTISSLLPAVVDCKDCSVVSSLAPIVIPVVILPIGTSPMDVSGGVSVCQYVLNITTLRAQI